MITRYSFSQEAKRRWTSFAAGLVNVGIPIRDITKPVIGESQSNKCIAIILIQFNCALRECFCTFWIATFIE
ncbi:hypothetical protein AN458_28950 [Pseudomonas aeruginosa]|nr:hypothetical protein AN458_28950 [Pseudomonas aeruginosa]